MHSGQLRLTAYLAKLEGRSVIGMSRSDYSRLVPGTEQVVLIDVQSTPLNSVASRASVMATTVEQFSTATAELTIYRDDPADAPTRVNQDRYLVLTDLPSHRSYEQIAKGVGLDKDQAARDYLRDNVLIVKQDPGPEHWLSAVPSSVQVLLKSVESTKSD